MNIIDFYKLVKMEIKSFNDRAKNPFIEKDYGYNPFESVFTRTHVWIEKQNDQCPK